MSLSNAKVTRSELVSTVAVPRGRWVRAASVFRRGDVLLRIGLCLLAAAAMWLACGGWEPPFPYRTGYAPPRDIVSRVSFQQDNPEDTRLAQQDARRSAVCVYANDPRSLDQLQQALKNKTAQILGAKSYSDVVKNAWREFLPEGGEQRLDEAAQQEAFAQFKQALAEDAELSQFGAAVKHAFDEIREDGLITKLEHEFGEGSQTDIEVRLRGDAELSRRVKVDKVLVGNAAARLERRLVDQFQLTDLPDDAADNVARRVFTWLSRRLPETETLSLDEEATREAKDEAARRVEPVMTTYEEGDLLARGGQPLTVKQLPLLRLEHDAFISDRKAWEDVAYALAGMGMYAALFALCGCYIYWREPRLLRDLRRFAALLGLVTAAVVLSRVASRDPWQAEIAPLLLLGMTAAIVYRQELALLLAAAVSLAVAFSLGLGLANFVISLAALFSVIFLFRRIRTRTKLIYVGLWTGLGVMAAVVGVGVLTGQPLGEPAARHAMLFNAARAAFCSVLAGVLMTGLLPFIEKLFDVQTDISLLELGDAAHPLLQELARRAPGTYNHSISVASLAETAAEVVGANGLLARVGAYFHDIGKILKPVYFVENQGTASSRHESLAPAMSTLVIIAHVKDGADLARQHRLPKSIIDFIEQHHGTTLVEYFYREAAKRSQSNPDEGEVDETTFRYPGPKPQTKETAVLMLADAAEGASRTLVDPAPSRIKSLVHDMAMKRLLDGQFDECGLTLRELRAVQDSLAKSLTAVYHGRVKYPSQQQSA